MTYCLNGHATRSHLARQGPVPLLRRTDLDEPALDAHRAEAPAPAADRHDADARQKTPRSGQAHGWVGPGAHPAGLDADADGGEQNANQHRGPDRRPQQRRRERERAADRQQPPGETMRLPRRALSTAACDEIGKARIRSQRVEVRLDREKDGAPGMLVERAAEPRDRFVSVAETRVHERQRIR
jgi:hypothetical protein